MLSAMLWPLTMHQDVAGVIARQTEAAHAHGFVAPVIAHIESAHGRQRFAERAVSILADILGRDDGHAGGSVLKSLRVKRGALDFDLHQLFEGQARSRSSAGLIGRLLVVRASTALPCSSSANPGPARSGGSCVRLSPAPGKTDTAAAAKTAGAGRLDISRADQGSVDLWPEDCRGREHDFQAKSTILRGSSACCRRARADNRRVPRESGVSVQLRQIRRMASAGFQKRRPTRSRSASWERIPSAARLIQAVNGKAIRESRSSCAQIADVQQIGACHIVFVSSLGAEASALDLL